MSNAQTSEFQPLTELFTPWLKENNSSNNTDPKDQANLITKVYTSLSIFDSATAERAPELLVPQIKALYEANPDADLEPFLQINLTPAFGLRTLLHYFDKKKPNNRRTWINYELLDKYHLIALNSRRTDDQSEPIPGLVRGHVLSPAENYNNEPGLAHTSKNTTHHRQLAIGQTLLSITDYITIQAMRRETDKQQLDTRTFTRFPQLPDKSFVGTPSVVRASWHYVDQLRLSASSVSAFPDSGFRVSLGMDKA